MKNIKRLIFSAILFLSVVAFAGCGRDIPDGAAGTLTDSASAVKEAESDDAESEITSEVTGTPGDDKTADTTPFPTEAQKETEAAVTIDPAGSYTTAADVALYIHLYGTLPSNFITKNEAKTLGWTGGGLEAYAPGKCIGGDYFGNYEGLLPDADYHECDIDTLGKNSRGAKRIIYSDKGAIYYTEDHYESFTQLY